MNVSFTKKDELNGTISVNITSADYLDNYEKRLKDYGKKANIPGFRAGHAPKSMIEKMVGNSLLLEEINSMASKGLFDYIEENKLAILGQPVLTEDTKIDSLTKGSEYTFNFDLGFSPEFTLDISSADSFSKIAVAVSDEMVNDEISRMAKRSGTLTDVEEVGADDMIYVHLSELNENGETFEGGVDAPSVPVAVNTIKDEELLASVKNLKKGDAITVNAFTLFGNNEMEMSHALGVQKQTIADLNPNFRMELKEIKRTQEAEINQEFFDKVFGKDAVTSEEEFREKIRTEIAGYYDQQAQHLLEHELFDSLVAKHNIQLPDEFLKRWMLDRYADKFTAENIDEAYIPEANYLRNHILEEKILTSNNLKVEEADIREAAVNYTKSMFGAYGGQGLSDDILNSIVDPQLQKEDFRSRMVNVAVRNKVNEFLLNTITIVSKEVTPDEFNSIVEAHNHNHHH